MIVTYEATDRLVPYHAEGSSYTLDIETQDVMPPSPQDLKSVGKAMAGNVEVQYHGTQRIWSVTTIPYEQSSSLFAIVDEFLSSTANGQIFTFDPFGNGGELNVVREDDGYTLSRFMQIDGPNDHYSFAFQVREV